MEDRAAQSSFTYAWDRFPEFLSMDLIDCRSREGERCSNHTCSLKDTYLGGTPENWQNEIGFFAIDNHMYRILKCEIYFGIINVVEVAERIHVVLSQRRSSWISHDCVENGCDHLVLVHAAIQYDFLFIYLFWSDFLTCSAPKAARSHSGYKSNFVCGGGKARNLQVYYMSSSGEISYSNTFVWASVGLGCEAVALHILGLCPLLSHVHTH